MTKIESEHGGKVRTRKPLTKAEQVPPLGSWHHVGDLRETVEWINGHVALVKRSRGGFAVVGHYRLAHVEIGPFIDARKAFVAWRSAREELEQLRHERNRTRREGSRLDERARVGTGWASQVRHAASCSECARRVEDREAKARGWGLDLDEEDSSAPSAPPLRRRAAALVRKRGPVFPTGGVADPDRAG